MPGDQLAQFQAVVDEAAAPPPAIAMFLQLCLFAGISNDFAVMALALTQHHLNGASAVAALILGAMAFPFASLPYWLALAVVYARHEWAWRMLYAGAVVFVLALIVRVSMHGAFGLLALCMIIGAGLGIAALVYLSKPPARAWLHSTAPVFAAVSAGS